MHAPAPAPFLPAASPPVTGASIHAPAVTLVVTMPAASPSILRTTERLRKGFCLPQMSKVQGTQGTQRLVMPSDQGRNGNMTEAGGQGIQETQGNQRSAVQALFQGIDGIDSQDGDLGPTQILDSRVPGAFPTGSEMKAGRNKGEAVAVAAVVPAVPVVAPVMSTYRAPAALAKDVRRKGSFSEEESENGEFPSFVKRVRQEWEAGFGGKVGSGEAA
ncbi:hypothetical protein EV426DRAFT_577400 [Tirmania nivea]|nr:hypothetical protein EV426DRAFT_577400 [Tirmania nivea]